MRVNGRGGAIFSSIQVTANLNVFQFVLTVVVAVALAVAYFFFMTSSYPELISERNELGLLDVLLYGFKGVPTYANGINSKFDIPVQWLTIQIATASIVALGAGLKNTGYSIQLQSRCHSRLHWWAAQHIWSIILVVVFYASFWASSIAIIWLVGGQGYAASDVATSLFLSSNVETPLMNYYVTFHQFVVSLLFSIILSSISIHIGALFGFIILFSYFAFSTVLCHPLFLGDISMIERIMSSYQNDLSLLVGILGSIAILVFSASALIYSIKDFR